MFNITKIIYSMKINTTEVRINIPLFLIEFKKVKMVTEGNF